MKSRHLILAAVLLAIFVFFADGGTAYLDQLLNRPPEAAFTYRTATRTLRYIAPTDQDLIVFLNNSTDPDGDPLTYEWRIDGTPVGASRDLSTELSPGGHHVELMVSDGNKEDAIAEEISVDRDQVYPISEIGIAYKGINYFIGSRFGSETDNPPDVQEMDESLEVIRNEMECNAIKIVGDYEDLLLLAGEMAIGKAFEVIILSPRYEHASPDVDIGITEHVNRVIEFSKKAEELRIRSNAIILCIGEELEVAVRGITNGTTYDQRRTELPDNSTFYYSVVQPKLRSYLQRLVEGVRDNFHGNVIYSSINTLFDEWDELRLDIVGPMMYSGRQEAWQYQALDLLMQQKKYGRTVFITEFGCETWEGASKWGGSASMYYNGQAYSQEEQANSIFETVEVFDNAQVDGIFQYMLLSRLIDDHKSWGLLKYEMGRPVVRKLGFYAYKSLTRNESSERIQTFTLEKGRSILIEAESVYVNSSFSAAPVADSGASGGMFLQPNNFLRLAIIVRTEGDYVISARVRGLGGEQDSFWVRFDGNFILWDIPWSWEWVQVRNRGDTMGKVFHLRPGRYVLEILPRELGSEIDALRIASLT